MSQPTPDAGTPSPSESSWATAVHLSFVAVLAPVPLGNVLGPLILWAIKREQSPYVAEHGRAAVNFQGTLTLALLACLPAFRTSWGASFATALALIGVAFVVRAAVRARRGLPAGYPPCIRFLGPPVNTAPANDASPR